MSVWCTYCGQEFSRAEHLHRHVLTHTNVRPYKCSTCYQSFKRRDLLQRHQVVHHKDSEDMQSDSDNNYPRRAIACTACAKAKTKCDKTAPCCGRCTLKGIHCEQRTTKRSNDVAYRQARRVLNLHRHPIKIAAANSNENIHSRSSPDPPTHKRSDNGLPITSAAPSPSPLMLNESLLGSMVYSNYSSLSSNLSTPAHAASSAFSTPKSTYSIPSSDSYPAISNQMYTTSLADGLPYFGTASVADYSTPSSLIQNFTATSPYSQNIMSRQSSAGQLAPFGYQMREPSMTMSLTGDQGRLHTTATLAPDLLMQSVTRAQVAAPGFDFVSQITQGGDIHGYPPCSNKESSDDTSGNTGWVTFPQGQFSQDACTYANLFATSS